MLVLILESIVYNINFEIIYGMHIAFFNIIYYIYIYSKYIIENNF